jgi:hypothetical protein
MLGETPDGVDEAEAEVEVAVWEAEELVEVPPDWTV